MINEDNSHFFGTRQADDMTLEGLHAFVDQYAGTEASHLFLCPNAMRAISQHDPRRHLGPARTGCPEPGFGGPWAANARLLHERGLDPYAAWIALPRKGLSPWLSMRMNDVHDVDNLKNFMHSTFWVEHPEYWRVPGGAGWTDRALDYAVPEVREHNMAFIRELLERYDPDGLELDWMRFGYHFAPGKEAEGCTLLTQFMRDVRALTREWSEKRGHAIQLGAASPPIPTRRRGWAWMALPGRRKDSSTCWSPRRSGSLPTSTFRSSCGGNGWATRPVASSSRRDSSSTCEAIPAAAP